MDLRYLILINLVVVIILLFLECSQKIRDKARIRILVVKEVPIYLSLTHFLFSLYLGIMSAFIFYLFFPYTQLQELVFLGLLNMLFWEMNIILHELSHLAMANHYDIEVKEINIGFIFGSCTFKKEIDEPVEDLMISIVGPITNLILGMTFIMIFLCSIGYIPV